MIATLIIGLFAVLLAYLNGRGILKNGLEMAFLVLTVFLAIRYDWGNDYMPYLQMFNNINRYDIGLFDFSTFTDLKAGEEGWVFLCRFFKPIGFFGMIVVLTIFENFVVFRFIKKYVPSNWFWLAVLIFVFNPALMVIGSSMMRQYLVICIYIIVVDLLLQKFFFYSILLILISVKIHTSALVLLVTIPLFYIKFKNQRFSVRTFLILVVVYLLWQNLALSLFENSLNRLFSISIFAKYSHYVENANTFQSGGLGLGVLLFQFLFLNLLYFQFKLKKNIRPLLYLFMISILLEPISAGIPLVGRIGCYFSMFGIVCFPLLITLIENKLYKKIILFSLLVFFSRSFYVFFYSEIWHEHFFVYKTIFSAPSWM